ncbi:acetate kinase [Candidatus Izimaplasma bacterium ZiA1]|uniref:acetate kinase n=1 Tax=Candidatus Izimoplasma sp. ZiA1 TaxID=2024899 RepID=UPI000BAA8F54|nr:acetate kinase [Candidatus Izimaplasma bacterium ZiA1]
MKIIAVNAGSSSLKFQLLQMPSETVITSGLVERIGLNDAVFTIKVNGEKISEVSEIPDHQVAVQLLLNKLLDLKIVESFDEITGVGHRVVHGGEKFSDSILITDEVIKAIEEVSDLAPLHNPANLTGIKAFNEVLTNAPSVAVFDTAFHQTMSEEVYMYSVPYEWYEKYGVRKYGFHGTSHKFVSQRAAEMLNKPIEDTKIIVCHVGNGASICAIEGGKSVDTSMGFTPLAGISMGTRSGDIDPAIVEYISTKENKNIQEVMSELNKKSGYLGLSELSSDSRDLWAAADKGDKKSMLAIKKQVKMISDYIGAYYLLMGGVDAICFTAGVGENAAETRTMIADKVAVLGAIMDESLNDVRGIERIISTEDSKVKLMLIPTNEEVMIARDTVRLIK